LNALTVGSGPNRLLRSGLAVLALVVCLIELHDLLTGYAWGVDVVIPLRAATRWLAGGQPYLASSFLAGPGYDLPYLYPPFVLPFVAPFTALPQFAVIVAWFLLSGAAAIFACRRLAIPWPAIPLLLVWPPFAEGLLGGNVQVVVFAAFVALLWRRPEAAETRPNFEPLERDLAVHDRPVLRGDMRAGVLATAVGALKASQTQPWLYLVRRNWRAAALGAVVLAGIGLLTLPILGGQLWFDWLAQLGRANDPDWILAGAWIGLLAVIGSPSLRVFGLLFALPAMLLVRREIALVAGLLMASYTLEGWWLAMALISGSLLLGRWLPGLLEPTSGASAGKAGDDAAASAAPAGGAGARD
jgi:hypothetical protein